jgi:hypothetical protein
LMVFVKHAKLSSVPHSPWMITIRWIDCDILYIIVDEFGFGDSSWW